MNDWLKKVVDEVDREFDDLPEWKKNSYQKAANCAEANSKEEDRPPSTIREPKSEE